jgi:cell division protein FtsB
MTASNRAQRQGPVRARSQTAPVHRPRPRPKPPLALVDERVVRSVRLRRTLLVAAAGLFVLALFGVGLVQAQLVQRQQVLDQTRNEIAETQAERLRLSHEVVVASSPEEIVRRALASGMVRAEEPVYLVAVRPVVDG